MLPSVCAFAPAAMLTPMYKLTVHAVDFGTALRTRATHMLLGWFHNATSSECGTSEPMFQVFACRTHAGCTENPLTACSLICHAMKLSTGKSMGGNFMNAFAAAGQMMLPTVVHKYVGCIKTSPTRFLLPRSLLVNHNAPTSFGASSNALLSVGVKDGKITASS